MGYKIDDNSALSIGKSLLLFSLIIAIELIASELYRIYLHQHATAQRAYLFIGILRLIDVSILFALLSIWGYKADIIGLSTSNMKKGIFHGVYWSLSFGGLIGLVGLIFFLIGKNPFLLFGERKGSGIHFDTFIIKIIIGCFLGPIIEDIVFIGILYNSIRKKISLPIAIIISASLFAFCHDSSFFISSIQVFASCLKALSLIRLLRSLAQFILRFFIQFIGGVLFSLSFEYSHSLLSPMIIHTLGNSALFLLTN